MTRDVIADMWPLYVAGEASPDTRALIEAFLRTDREFEQKLTEVARERLPNLLVGPRPLLQLALVFSCLAFGRLVSDTSFRCIAAHIHRDCCGRSLFLGRISGQAI